MDRPTCKTCPYWDDESDPKFREAAEWTDTTGYCRIARATINDTDESGDAIYQRAVWLVTTADEFCGEHPEFPCYIGAAKAARLLSDAIGSKDSRVCVAGCDLSNSWHVKFGEDGKVYPALKFEEGSFQLRVGPVKKDQSFLLERQPRPHKAVAD